MTEAGATVILNGRYQDLLDKCRKELEAQGYHVDTEVFDVTETKNVIAGMDSGFIIGSNKLIGNNNEIKSK